MQNHPLSTTYKQLLQKQQGRGLSETHIQELLRQVLAQLAQIHEQGQAHGSISIETLCQVGSQVVLTPPAQFSSANSQSISEDIYALGVVAIELLTGKTPNLSRSTDGYWLWEDECCLTDRLKDTIAKMIDENDSTRFQSASQAFDMLRFSGYEPEKVYSGFAAQSPLLKTVKNSESNSRFGSNFLLKKIISILTTSLAVITPLCFFSLWNLSVPKPISRGIATQKENKIWNNNKVVNTFAEHTDEVNSISFDSDKNIIVSGSNSNIIKFHNFTNSESLATLSGWLSLDTSDTGNTVEMLHTISDDQDFPRFVYAVKLSKDNRFLVITSTNQIHVWDNETGKRMYTMSFHGGKKTVSISPDNKTMVIGNQLIDFSSGKLICEFSELDCKNSQEKFLIIDSTGNIFDENRNQLSIKECCHRLKYVAPIDSQGAIKDLEGKSIPNPNCQPRFICVQSDSTLFPININGYETFDIDIEFSHTSKPGLISGWGIIGNSQMSSDGRFLVLGDSNEQLKIWNLDKKKLVNTIKLSPESSSFSISPNGKVLAVALRDKTIVFYDLETARKLGSVNKLLSRNRHKEKVTSLAFSQDNNFLASGSADQTIKIWDLRTGKLVSTLSAHTGTVKDLLFTPDGKRLISASSDKTVKIWE